MSNPYQEYGLSCPADGSFYICDKAKHEFIGCCTIYPCDRSDGCPTENLRSSTFSSAKYDDLPMQSCGIEQGSQKWWTCSKNKPPFMGCCNIDPCQNGGCPQASLIPARLTNNDTNREAFLFPGGNPASSTSVSTSSSTPTSAAAETIPAANNSNSGLSTGAIAGIAVGIGLLVLGLLGFFMYKFGWTAAKRKARREEAPSEQSPPTNPTDPSQAEAAQLYQGSPYNEKAEKLGSYRDSYQSSNTAFSRPPSHLSLTPDMHNGTPSHMSFDPRLSTGGAYLTPPVNGQHPHLPVVHEIDSTEVPMELGAGAVYQAYQAGRDSYQPPRHQSAELHSPPSSPGPNFDASPLNSPRTVPLDSANVSRIGSPVGSPIMQLSANFAPVEPRQAELDVGVQRSELGESAAKGDAGGLKP